MALQLTVVTPEGQAYDGQVEQVVLPGAEGDFGVLEQHERFLAALRPGAVEIRGASGGSGSAWMAVSDGFADVSSEQVVVLVSRCDLGAAIDRGQAQSEIDAAQAALRDVPGGEPHAHERAEHQRTIEAARIRLEVAGKS